MERCRLLLESMYIACRNLEPTHTVQLVIKRAYVNEKGGRTGHIIQRYIS